MPETAGAAPAASESFGAIGIVGAPSDSLTEDAILDSPVEVGTEVAEEVQVDAGKPDADGAPAEGAERTEAAKPDAAAISDAVPGSMPKELTALFKDPSISANPAFKAAMPRIQSAFDQLAQVQAVFPTVRAVHDFAQAFPGGLEEAKAAAQKATILDAADDEFKGAPETQRALAEEWHSDDPEAFASMFVQSAAVLQAKNPQQYEQITNQVFLDRMSSVGFSEQIEGFRQAIAAGDMDRLKGLTAWMVQEADKRGIQYKKSTGNIDPNVEAAKRDREAAATDRSAAFTERVEITRGQIAGSVHTSVTQSVSAVANKALEGTAFSDAGKTAIRQEIVKAMDAAIQADKNIQRQIAQHLKEGFRSGGNLDAAKKAVVALLTGRAKAIVGQASKKVIEEWTARIVASNQDTNARRTAAGARTDVGTGGASPAIRTRKLTSKDTEGMSDDQIMEA